jgi:hypothetical protein
MAEPIPPELPSDAPPALPRRVKISWRRVRTYLWSILLVLAIYFYGVATMIRHQPKRLAEGLLAQLPYPSSIGSATWLDRRRLEFREVKIGGFFYAYSIIVTASIPDLIRHHVTEIDIHGPQLSTGPLFDALSHGGKDGQGAGLDWTITKLIIRRGTLMLDNLAPDMPAIPVRLGVVQPIILNYIHLKKPDESPSMIRERMVEIENVNIVSPFDPLAPVLSFPLTRIRFTYKELWHHHLREVALIRPVIHLGQDLFWFSDEFKKERKTTPPEGVHAPWEVGHFAVQYGQLGVNVFGQPAVLFPFFFATQVDNIRLDQLDKISAKTTVAIQRLDKDYPEYKIHIANLSGKLEFSIPPSNANANNVVPTVHIDELSWNGIAATKVSSSVTFDPTGIYGKFDGNCEGGYLQGNFEVYYTNGFAWNADFFANKINCQPISEKLASKYFNLTGTLDGEIGVQGKATDILSCKGELGLSHDGKLEIHALDNLLDRLPASTSTLERDAMKIGIRTLQAYPYHTGELKVDYSPQAGGVGTLNLDSTNGKRQFAIYWHPYESSKVAKAGDNR